MDFIGKYQLLERIGAGGMAEVFLARTIGEGGFEKLVAIKRTLPRMAEKKNFVEMFIDEARISANLNHSNIGQIFEFGRAGDCYFIAMEYIHGLDLRTIQRHLRRAKKAMHPSMAAFLMTQVCAALAHAHAKTDPRGQPLGIIHRDVSPSNVLVSFEGEVKLIDFGIAKAAHRSTETEGPNLKGKFAYMSPEQAFGKGLDQRSDIFSAGTLFFELLTSRNPFIGKNDIQTLENVRHRRLVAPSEKIPGLSPTLDRICLKAMALNPEDRYPSAGDLQDELEAYQREAPFTARKMAQWMEKHHAEDRRKKEKILFDARQKYTTKESIELMTAGLAPGAVSPAASGPPQAVPPPLPAEAGPAGSGSAGNNIGAATASAKGSIASPLAPPSTPRARVATPLVEVQSEPIALSGRPRSEGSASWSANSSPSGSAPPRTPQTGGVSRRGDSSLIIVDQQGAPAPSPSAQAAGVTAARPTRDSRTLSVSRRGDSSLIIVGQSGEPAHPPQPSAGSPANPRSRQRMAPSRSAAQAPSRRQQRRRPAGMKKHVVLFFLFAAAVVLGIYFFLPGVRPSASGTEAGYGALSVTIDKPLVAGVFVDGDLHGTMDAGQPYLVPRLAPGEHQIQLRSVKFAQVETTVKIEVQKTTSLHLEVDPYDSPPQK